MNITDLFESEDFDSMLRGEAVKAYDTFMRRMNVESINGYESLLAIDTGPFYGGYIVPAEKVGLKQYGVYAVVFLPKDGRVRASLGKHKSGEIVLFFNVLLEDFSLKHLYTRMSGFKKDFVHEWSHHQLNDRYSVNATNRDTSGIGDIDRVAYYNHPHETQAYYQEMAFEALEFFKTVSEYASTKLEKFSNMTTPELVSFIKEKFGSEEFVSSLNQKNMRALDKRLARMIEETLRPSYLNKPH